MANYGTAALVKAQAKLIGAFASAEKRFRTPEVHNLFLRNTNIMIPGYEQLRTREDRTVETNYFLRTSRALGSARAHNHTGAQGDSGVLTPSWTTYTDKFASTLKEADNKIYDGQEMFMDKLENSIANFMEGLDAAASGVLFAARTGVNAATAEGAFDATDDVFKITESTNGNRAIQITKMVMDINKYQNTGFTLVCDSIAYNKFQFDAAQGAQNATNTSFQFMGVTFIHDPALTAAAAGLVGAYAKGFWIAVPDGTLAGLPWIPLQNRQGITTSVNTYGQIINPVDGLPYAIHTYESRADGTSKGGYTQDVVIETEISLDMAYEVAPLSTATASAQFAFALV